MGVEKKNIIIDTYEEGAVIGGLNKIRTEQLQKKENANFISDHIHYICHWQMPHL